MLGHIDTKHRWTVTHVFRPSVTLKALSMDVDKCECIFLHTLLWYVCVVVIL